MKKNFMKKFLSILSVTAVLTASTAFAAEVTTEDDIDLIVNGTFQSVAALESDAVYGSATIKTGTYLPTDWVVESVTASPASGNSIYKSGSSSYQLAIAGKELSINQYVNGIEECKSYTLTFDSQRKTWLVAKVTFLRYEDGKYITLEEYKTKQDAVDESVDDDITLMEGRLLDSTVTEIMNSEAISYSYCASMTTNTMNFVTPPYTNAVKISFYQDGASTSQVTMIDNVSLKLGNEIINNGSFDFTTSGNNAKGWTSTYFDNTNKYVVISQANVGATCLQRFLLVSGKTYMLSFKYKHTLTHENANTEPYLVISGFNGDPYPDPFPIKAVGTDGDWTLYEGYLTAPASGQNSAFGVVNMEASFRTRNEDNWSGSVYYDDVSLKEVSELSYADDGSAVLRYSQIDEDATAKLIVAAYDHNNGALVNAELFDAGQDVSKGFYRTYTVPTDETRDYRIFLWNNMSELVPLIDASERTALLVPKSLPVAETFDTAGYTPLKADGYTYSGSGSLTVSDDGVLTLANSNTSGTKQDAHHLTLSFAPVSSGVLVVEGDVISNNSVLSKSGLFTVFDSNNNVVANVAMDGRGANGSVIAVNGATDWNSRINNASWQGTKRVKFVIDFTSKTYTVWQGTPKTGGYTWVQMTATNNSDKTITSSEFGFTATEASKLRINLTENGDGIDNLNIYMQDEASVEAE